MEHVPVLAICGSLRRDSLHRALLVALQHRAPRMRFMGEDLVADLPFFNEDLEGRNVPAPVREFRLLAEAAHAIVISSPEYLHAPSGVTKNALDWLMGSLALKGKPTLLVSASPGETGGVRGLVGLIPTLQLMDAVLVDPVSVSRAPARILTDGEVTDAGLDLRLEIAIDELTTAMIYADPLRRRFAPLP